MGGFNNLLFGDLKKLTSFGCLALQNPCRELKEENSTSPFHGDTSVCPTQCNEMESTAINYLIPDAISILPVGS